MQPRLHSGKHHRKRECWPIKQGPSRRRGSREVAWRQGPGSPLKGWWIPGLSEPRAAAEGWRERPEPRAAAGAGPSTLRHHHPSPLLAPLSSRTESRGPVLVPGAAVPDDHKPGASNKFILPPFWRLGPSVKGPAGRPLPWRLHGNPSCLFQPLVALEFLGLWPRHCSLCLHCRMAPLLQSVD